MSHIRLERQSDAAVIESIVDRAFGPDRQSKTVYKLRGQDAPIADLAFVAVVGTGGIVASIRYWPVEVAGRPALLLGPLAVEPDRQGEGFGKALVHHSLAVARKLGHAAVILVGDPEYYEAFGFRRAVAAGLSLPGWVDDRRFLGLELVEGALAGAVGTVTAPRGATPLSGRPASTPARPEPAKAGSAARR